MPRKRLSDRVAEFFRAQQRYPVGSEYTRLAEQHELESDLADTYEGITHARDVIDDTFREHLDPASYAALRDENVRVALQGHSTDSGSVQLRAVNKPNTEPRYDRPTAEERAHKQAVETEAQNRDRAQQQAAEEKRQADWRVERKRIIAQQERVRRDHMLHGAPDTALSYLTPPSVQAPAWFGRVDGVQRYVTLPPVVKHNEDGTRTVDFERNPITGAPLNAPEPAKSPEQVFEAER